MKNAHKTKKKNDDQFLWSIQKNKSEKFYRNYLKIELELN